MQLLGMHINHRAAYHFLHPHPIVKLITRPLTLPGLILSLRGANKLRNVMPLIYVMSSVWVLQDVATLVPLDLSFFRVSVACSITGLVIKRT